MTSSSFCTLNEKKRCVKTNLVIQNDSKQCVFNETSKRCNKKKNLNQNLQQIMVKKAKYTEQQLFLSIAKFLSNESFVVEENINLRQEGVYRTYHFVKNKSLHSFIKKWIKKIMELYDGHMKDFYTASRILNQNRFKLSYVQEDGGDDENYENLVIYNQDKRYISQLYNDIKV